MSQASLLDCATSAAAAMAMRLSAKARGVKTNVFYVDELTHPHILSVMRTRAT